MDTTTAGDDTKLQSDGDDTAPDSDEEDRGPDGKPVIKHFTYAGTRIPHWLVKNYPDDGCCSAISRR